MPRTTAAKDMDAWKKWNENRNDVNRTRDLLKQTENIRYNAISNWKGSVSPVTLNSEAVRISMNAFQTFDPKMNVKLSTHLTNSLKKLSRLGYQEVSFLRMPEERQMKFTTYDTARSDLRDRLGRDPSAMELSDELGWPVAEVNRFMQEDRKLLISSEPLPSGIEQFQTPRGIDPNDKTHFVLADMNPVDQQIFMHTTGYAGAPVLDGKALMDKLNINQSQLSYRKQVIAKEFKKIGR